jgi:hypothetical protein
VKGWKTLFYANRNKKQAGVLMLISDEIDLESKSIKRDKGAQYIMLER